MRSAEHGRCTIGKIIGGNAGSSGPGNRLPVVIAGPIAAWMSLGAANQGVAEYRYQFVRDATDWLTTVVVDRWYFVLLGVVVLALLWRSLRS